MNEARRETATKPFRIKPYKEPVRIRKAWQKLTSQWPDFDNPGWLKRSK